MYCFALQRDSVLCLSQNSLLIVSVHFFEIKNAPSDFNHLLDLLIIHLIIEGYRVSG